MTRKILFIFFAIVCSFKCEKIDGEIDCKENKGIYKRKIYFDMDGNIDDIVCLLLLLSFQNIEVVGITITPGDCDIPPAMEAVSKILHKKNVSIPIVASNIEGINPFPQSFKDLTVKALVLPTFLNFEYTHKNELQIEASDHIYLTAKKIFLKFMKNCDF